MENDANRCGKIGRQSLDDALERLDPSGRSTDDDEITLYGVS
jgi:hypothetical protein